MTTGPRRTPLWRIAALAAALGIAVGCGAGAADVVDGWPIGPAVNCSGDETASCERLTRAAIDALDRRDLGHPVILRVVLHDEAPAVDVLGNPILMTRSVQLLVARFELADGTVRGIGVGESPGEPVTVEYGP